MDFGPSFSGNIPSEQVLAKYHDLVQAIRSGNKIRVQHLVNTGVPVNCPLDFPGLTPLHLAIQSRSAEIAKILLDKGADIDAKCHNGDTPLTLAAKSCSPSLVDLLLSRVVNNCKNGDNLSHLHVACMRNRVGIVRKLLLMDNGLELNKPVSEKSMFWQGYCALHFAVHFGCIETVSYLLKCGADIMAIDSRKLTPLHLADIQRNTEIIDLLLSAHKREFKNPVSPLGLTHFHIACTRDDATIVEHFLNLGVDVDLAVECVSESRWSAWKPIQFATYYKCPAVIKLLLQRGVCISTSLIELLKYEFMMKNGKIYNLFAERNTVLVEKPNDVVNLNVNRLCKACIHYDIPMIEQLLNDSAVDVPLDLNALICNKYTALHLAVKCETLELIKYLLDNGAKVLIQDVRGETPLHIAFYRRATKILVLMLESLMNETENVIDHDGLSVFHILCSTDKIKEIEYFLQIGIDVNAQVLNKSEFWAGFTALHFACMYSQSEVVKLLLQNHADILITNNNHLNPFDFVTERMVAGSPCSKYQYSLIIEVIIRLLPPGFEKLNRRAISVLHTPSFLYEKDLDILRDHLVKHKDEINNTIEVSPKFSKNKCTPLHLVMKFFYFKLAKMMIEFGADPLILDGNGRTPLECGFTDNGWFLDRLVEHDATLLSFKIVSQTSRPSHFHMACCMGRSKVIKDVLSVSDKKTRKKLVTFRDDNGRTPLHILLKRRFASSKSRKTVTRLLLENGADADARDFELQTPLHFANRFGDVDIVSLLIEHGANVNARDIYGNTALVRFCCNNSVEQIIVLLRNGADMNITDEYHRTCLLEMFDAYPQAPMIDRENEDKAADCIIELLKQVKRLQLIGSRVSDEVQCTYEKLLPLVSQHFDEGTFKNLCVKELELMRTVNIGRHITLRDILSRSVNQMVFCCENSNLQKMINSKVFFKKYPNYGHFVRLQMKQGTIRRILLTNSKKSVTNLFGIALPRDCINIILLYLSDTDLRNVISSIVQSEKA